MQYQSMSAEQKNRISNRVRQWALKARVSMPLNDHGMFCLVAAHLLKNAHRYFNINKPSELQTHILEDKTISEAMRQKVIQDFKEANKKLRAVNDLKSRNRILNNSNWLLI